MMAFMTLLGNRLLGLWAAHILSSRENRCRACIDP